MKISGSAPDKSADRHADPLRLTGLMMVGSMAAQVVVGKKNLMGSGHLGRRSLVLERMFHSGADNLLIVWIGGGMAVGYWSIHCSAHQSVWCLYFHLPLLLLLPHA